MPKLVSVQPRRSRFFIAQSNEISCFMLLYKNVKLPKKLIVYKSFVHLANICMLFL